MKMVSFLPISGFLTLGILAGTLWVQPKSVTGGKLHGGSTNRHPRELGNVEWIRTYAKALDRARTERKDMLILFQEIPGCATCVGYGQEPMGSGPLLS